MTQEDFDAVADAMRKCCPARDGTCPAAGLAQWRMDVAVLISTFADRFPASFNRMRFADRCEPE